MGHYLSLLGLGSAEDNAEPEMSWSLIQKYVNALPDDLIFDGENITCQVKNDDSTKLSLKAFQRLWSELSNPASSTPTPEFVTYLRKEVHCLPNASELSSQLNDLGKTLSVTMKGLQLKVTIADTLTALLSKVFSEEDPGEIEEGTGHRVTVVMEIPEFNTPPSNPDDLEEKLSQLYIESLPALKWHKEAPNYLENFSVKLGPLQLPNMEEITEKVFDRKVNDAQALVALAVVVKCYPEKWRQIFFWDAWLAVTLQLCTLPSDGMYVFPCVWIRQNFEAERYLSDPADVKHLLFGIDPVSKTYSYDLKVLCRATGIAFHAVGNDNRSIEGMKTHYGLNCDDDNPIKYCKNGLLMTNMVRCIRENDRSLTNNSCRRAWVAYTLRIMHYFSSSPRRKPIFVLTSSSSAMTKLYIPNVCEGVYVQGPHPSIEPREYHEDEVAEISGYLKNYR